MREKGGADVTCKLRFDAVGREGGHLFWRAVEEDDVDDIVANVPFPFQLFNIQIYTQLLKYIKGIKKKTIIETLNNSSYYYYYDDESK